MTAQRTSSPLSALLCIAVMLVGCSREPEPDARIDVPVANGDVSTYLQVEAWRSTETGPCRVRISGAHVSNWVRANGVLPRMTLAPEVVRACTGTRPYLAAIDSSTEGGPARWSETAGPSTSARLSIYVVDVQNVGDDDAHLSVRVERVARSAAGLMPDARPAQASLANQQLDIPRFTRDEVLEARKHYQVEVLAFDQTNVFGQGYDQSNLLKVRVTNNSTIVLPHLTVLTKRWSASGELLGSSRAPAISVRDLKPGTSADFDYFAKGALPGTARVTIEVEQRLTPRDEEFIAELPK